MTNLLREPDLPSNYELFLYSDIHVGSKAFHEVAFKEMLRDLKRKKNAYAICLGDLIEGQTTAHHHYDHTTIADGGEFDFDTPGGQFDAFEALVEPVASKHLGMLLGNHDWRHEMTDKFVQKMCARLDITYLGPRAHAMLDGVNLFLSHKGKRYTNSQGSPAQQMAAMQESCRRFFSRTGGKDFWQSAHGMFHGDTHQLLLAPPQTPHAQLMTTKHGRHAQRSVDPSMFITKTPEGFIYVPPEARWCGATGTFRRGGDIIDVSKSKGHDRDVWFDYAEKEPYKPSDVGYIRLRIKDGRIVDGATVS